jgi:flagella basal body P-ring formation protein FlgA
MMRFKLAALVFILSSLSAMAGSEIDISSVKAELEKNYPGTRIELRGFPQIEDEAVVLDTRLVREKSPGQAIVHTRYQVQSETKDTEYMVTFSAWQKALIAQKRIFPGERLNAADFLVKEVDMASAWARQYRGLVLPITTHLADLETRQTILEGQFPLLSGVQKTPDVKIGESIKVTLIAGALVLTVSGTVDQPANVGEQIRVTAGQKKQHLVGKLQEDKSVVVNL